MTLKEAEKTYSKVSFQQLKGKVITSIKLGEFTDVVHNENFRERILIITAGDDQYIIQHYVSDVMVLMKLKK